MARKDDCNPDVALPPGLTPGAILKSIDYIERELADLVEIYYEQMNVFSAIVGIFGTKALDSVSNYEKHRHADTAQQRFPDLCRRGFGTSDPCNCLESKASKRPWAIQSHYDHPAGTSFGGISSIQRNRLNGVSRSSSGASMWSSWKRRIGSTRRASPASPAAAELTPLGCEMPHRNSKVTRFTSEETSSSVTANPSPETVTRSEFRADNRRRACMVLS